MNTLEILVGIIAGCHVFNCIGMVMVHNLTQRAKDQSKENVHKEHVELFQNQKMLLARIEKLEAHK